MFSKQSGMIIRQLTVEGQEAIEKLAIQHQLSKEAVAQMLQSVANGGGTMAQFNIPAFGGNGQWMRGGMTMVGDMFNHNLKAQVNSLCEDLSQLLNNETVFSPMVSSGAGTATNANAWWPTGFGMPSSSGAQNNMRYAFFSAAHRLVIDANGQLTIYDTADHQISGVSQQQGGDSTIQFTSQKGGVRLGELSIIDGDESTKATEAEATDTPAIVAIPPENPPTENPPIEELPIENPPKATIETSVDILNTIQQLGDLHAKGILTEKEFQEKKTELLARL